MKNLYINNRFFYLLILLGALYVLSFFFKKIIWIPNIIVVLLLITCILDILLLFGQKNAISAIRTLPEKLSNGDQNHIKIDVKNGYFFPSKLTIIDEIPYQFQKRDFKSIHLIKSNQNHYFQYDLSPKERGEYTFGNLNVYATSPLGLISKRFRFQNDVMIPSYPSFIHLKKYELMALQNEFLLGGIKKIRRLGHTMEFEQIREYVQGDDIRTINWKATSKHNKMMVNQYQDEKAQRIYLLIDKGRTMQMPFEGLSLLDYSINSAMALAHIIIRKGDRAGMMTFSKKAQNKVAADNKSGHLKKISEALYNCKTNFVESDYSTLYQEVKYNINQRSLLILFTNFETLDAVNRQMKYLRAIAKNHLLLVVFFKNSELQNMIKSNPQHLQDIYDSIIAEKLEFEKKLIIQELKKYGIHTLYTLPENLSIEAINSYLEIKSRGIL